MKRTLTLLATTALLSLAALGADDEATWTAKVAPAMRKSSAFAWVQEDPALPRVLIIGDSISIGYTTTVREALKGKANVLRIPANGGSTKDGLAKLDEWLGAGPWKVIHFNWGLHDLKHMDGKKLDLSGPVVTPLDEYEKNLLTLVARLKKTGAKLIWASTTPVPEKSDGRPAGEEVKYNEVAAKVMKAEGVEIDDLATAVRPKLGELQRPNNVHYLPAGDKFLGDLAAGAIVKAL